MRTLTVSSLALLLSACSAYQNAGRKYLEKSAYDYTGLKIHDKLIGCNEPVTDDRWTQSHGSTAADTYVRDTPTGYELRVEPVRDRGAYACDYVFQSADDRAAMTGVAIDATLTNPR